ncbi:calcium-dependent protein kinase-like protein [Striga asiatica]|uniref:non-specific serine/threonine protein kinase n=1 Tax=Striga asiatica TaxID=4170 RepID=A0A5A7R4Z2_STRAF|nr:calcium-dependent protein kinase-like protein [Striga asiatica]
MGLCHGKPTAQPPQNLSENPIISGETNDPTQTTSTGKPTKFPFYSPSPLPSAFKNSPGVLSTPLRFLKRPFPPPSPAKHIKSLLARRHGPVRPSEATIPELTECEIIGLDKNFGFCKNFVGHYEMGEEVGRGHFGYTCSAKGKKGSLRGKDVAVKVIPKSKLITAISIEDVRREVKILRALTGHRNLVQFYDAYEDEDNVYIVMELCKGGELLDRILSKGGKYAEEDARIIMVQILSVVAYCHLQGVVHRDLKPEYSCNNSPIHLHISNLAQNFLFTSKDEHSQLKAIDFGLSDYVKPDERLNDIVGSAYYVAPEVLHRSYGTEADMWSIGVIAYILLCGSRPFWSRTESGIFRDVLKAEPSFDEAPWPSLSLDAIDFVKRLLNKNYRKRLTAAQALCHPWLAGHHDVKIPLDMLMCKLVKAYVCSTSLRKAALGTENLKEVKFMLRSAKHMKGGDLNTNSKKAMSKNSTDAMKDSWVLDYVNVVSSLQYKKLNFKEFCGAAISVYQLEGMVCWEQLAKSAYDFFDKDENRAIKIEELASELGLSPSVPVHVVLQDWIRHSDGKLSFLGFVRLLHGFSSRSIQKLS